jgi:hypothetical protein
MLNPVQRIVLYCSAMAISVVASETTAQQPRLELRKGDHIAIIGNTLADRLQHLGIWNRLCTIASRNTISSYEIWGSAAIR